MVVVRREAATAAVRFTAPPQPPPPVTRMPPPIFSRCCCTPATVLNDDRERREEKEEDDDDDGVAILVVVVESIITADIVSFFPWDEEEGTKGPVCLPADEGVLRVRGDKSETRGWRGRFMITGGISFGNFCLLRGTVRWSFPWEGANVVVYVVVWRKMEKRCVCANNGP